MHSNSKKNSPNEAKSAAEVSSVLQPVGTWAKKDDSKDAKKKEAKVFVNKNASSNIHSIEIHGKDSLFVHFKNDSSAFIKGNRIVHFLDRAETEIDNDLKNEVKKYYKEIFEKFDNTRPRLEQTDVNNIYAEMYRLICEAKNKAIAKGKPLHIIIGENHYSQNALLHKLIILDIAKRLGINLVCLEITPERKAIYDKGEMNNPLYSSGNQDYLFLSSKVAKLNVVPVDDETLRDSTVTLLKAQTLVDKNKLDEKSYAELTDSYSERRDRHIALKIANTTLDRDEKGHTLFKNDMRVTIVGAGHLRGIIENELIADLYHILPVNCSEGFSGDKIFYEKSSYNSKSRFFALNAPHVVRLTTEKDCSFYTNIELHELVVNARQSFQINQLNIFRKEYKVVIDKVSEAIQESKVEVEKMLAMNLNKVIKSISNDKSTPPDVKRIELRAAVSDTVLVMKNKNLASDSSVFFRKLQEINNTLGITPTLNIAEYKNVKKILARK